MRCRPINKKEKDERARRCVEVSEKSGEIRVGKKTYTFDKVFGPQSGQIEVYQNIVTPIINEVLQGKIFKLSENCTFEFAPISSHVQSVEVAQLLSLFHHISPIFHQYFKDILARFLLMARQELVRPTPWRVKGLLGMSSRGNLIPNPGSFLEQ